MALEDLRYIVRIANKDLNGTLPIYMALTNIRGVGIRFGKILAKKFEEKSGISSDLLLGNLPEDKDSELEDIVLNPQNYNIPTWLFNSRNDYHTGKNSHLIMNDLALFQRNTLKRLGEIKSYRGLRLTVGLKVRGQRTKNTGRKGRVIEVTKRK